MSRADNIAKFGGNSALEAEGLEVVRHALACDGRLTFVKCFEGARADFCVYLNDPNRVLGVQLKTTQRARQLSKTSYQYRFSDTNGYGGLALLCIALDSCVKFWLMPGDDVTATSVGIPTIFKKGQKYAKHQTHEIDLADDFIHILEHPSDSFQLDTVASFNLPTNKKQQTEYWAFQHLKDRLPLDFSPAPIEGSAYDHVVDGQKWQLKVAHHTAPTDRYMVTLQKSGGRIPNSKKRKRTQYEEMDFDWLCVQLPPKLNRAYLIPFSVLLKRRLVSRSTCTTGTIHLYFHRSAHPKTEWIEDYKIDLSTHQTSMRDYRRITGSNACTTRKTDVRVMSSEVKNAFRCLVGA